MECIKTWRNSLEFFKPAQCKLFVLVTLNAYRQMCKVILINWWFLAPLFLLLYIMVPVILSIIVPSFLDLIMPMSAGCANIILLGGYFIFCGFLFSGVNLILFCFCLATRASMQRKTVRYFFHYLASFWYLLLFYVPSDFLLLDYANGILPAWVFRAIMFLYVLGKTLVVFFVFDGERSLGLVVRAAGNATHFMWYNVPLIFLLFMAHGVGMSVHRFLHGIVISMAPMIGGIFSIVWTLFSLSLMVVILANVYIKQIHDQSKYYFPQPS